MLSNSPQSPWEDEYVPRARTPPKPLQSTLLSHPQVHAARSLVAELTGVENPSPTFIIESITALSQSQETPQLPGVAIEEHQPGVNDMMSGAINSGLQPYRTPEELADISQEDNNATICRYEFRYLDNFMPYKLFSIREIAGMDIFHGVDNISLLPVGFHTTTLGLKKVWLEIWKGQAEAVYDDEQLLTELLKVGGMPRQMLAEANEKAIIYPEDLLPCTAEDEWDNDHRTYWSMISDLRKRSWEEDEAGQDEDGVE